MHTPQQIPKKIHFIWMGNPLPPRDVDTVRSFCDHNPDYEINLWTDRPAAIELCFEPRLNEPGRGFFLDPGPSPFEYRLKGRERPFKTLTPTPREHSPFESPFMSAFASPFAAGYPDESAPAPLEPRAGAGLLQERQRRIRIRTFSELNIPFSRLGIMAHERHGAYRNLAAVSDVVRLEVLFAEGGIYLDTDIDCRKGFGTLVAQHGVLFDGDPRIGFNNCVIAAVPGCPYLVEVLRAMERAYYEEGAVSHVPTLAPHRAVELRFAAKRSNHDARALGTLHMTGPLLLMNNLPQWMLGPKNWNPRGSGHFPAASVQFPQGYVDVRSECSWLRGGLRRHNSNQT